MHELKAKKTAASKEKDATRRQELEDDIAEAEPIAYLPPPIGWPCSAQEDDESSGLPPLTIMMQVMVMFRKCLGSHGGS